MTDGDAEYFALAEALLDTDPACAGDPRFTVDDRNQLHPQEQVYMRSLCRTCPLEQLCDNYAQAARPPLGLWAGTFYHRKDRQR